jgi:hypothetical protein
MTYQAAVKYSISSPVRRQSRPLCRNWRGQHHALSRTHTRSHISVQRAFPPKRPGALYRHWIRSFWHCRAGSFGCKTRIGCSKDQSRQCGAHGTAIGG